MNTIEILQAARAEVEKGWCKSGLEDADGNVCVLGALKRVDLGSAVSPELLSGEGIRAYGRVDDHIPGGVMMHEYNNAATTTKQDILNLFDKTLASLGGLA